MNLNRNIPCALNSLADSDVVDQNFHHLAGQVFYMNIAQDDCQKLLLFP